MPNRLLGRGGVEADSRAGSGGLVPNKPLTMRSFCFCSYRCHTNQSEIISRQIFSKNVLFNNRALQEVAQINSQRDVLVESSISSLLSQDLPGKERRPPKKQTILRKPLAWEI